MAKMHYLDIEHDLKIPWWNRYKGYRGTVCGYQRENVTLEKDEVTCKLCLREMRADNG